ncbi:MAG: glycosyltransferase family 2 protein [Candidatus Levybacteria bacterium]|nr:glycosyltransferase family 2 protein [Candidatus Levybacteria bacterium]
MNPNVAISIIIPTLNEEDNVMPLVKRIHTVLTSQKITYEILFIDDKSTDKTREIIQSLTKKYPVQFFTKVHQPGKAQSLIEGLAKAQYDYCGFIDADLQYPPEAIPQMITKLIDGSDIVVANRKEQQTSFIRRLASRTFMYLFARVLHGIKCDVQSGLKVFRKEVFASVAIAPSPWTFDMEFLVKARALGYTIGTVPITFTTRVAGQTKINLIGATIEIGFHALKLKAVLLAQSIQQFLQTLKSFRISE